AILSLQFAPDLAAVAAACGDGVVVWLETDGWSPSHSIRLTPGEESIVYRWVIAPDGQTCAGSLHIPRDGLRDRYEIVLWNRDSEREPDLDRTLLGHVGWIGGLDFAPSEPLLASGAFDESVCLWDFNRRSLLAESREHQGAVYGVAFSVNGDIVASCSADGSIKLWSVAEAMTSSGGPRRRSGAEPQTAEDVLATLLSAGSRRGRDALVLMAQDFLDNLMSLR